MNKLNKALSAIAMILRKPYLLNHILDADENVEKQIIKKFGYKDGLPVIEITDLFDGGFEIEIHPYAFLDGSCTPLDIALLKGLATRFEIKKYLEIGTWRGESVANVASVAQSCITINLPDEDILKLGMTPEYVKMHRLFSESIPHVKHIHSNSITFDYSSLKESFDMVFIDGDHHSEMVEADSRNIFNFINPDETIVVWHDYASNPEKIRWNVLQGILAGTPEQYHKNIFHVSHTLCALYIPESFNLNLPTRKFAANRKPDFSFRVKIQAERIKG